MFLLLAVHGLFVVTFARHSAAADTCVFRDPAHRESPVIEAISQSVNNTICPPGAIRIDGLTESLQDIVISWAEAPCEVSGYFVHLIEAGGIGADLKSDLCNGTKINLKRDQTRFFSNYSVQVYSARVSEDSGIIISAPSSKFFAICPNRKPESPVDVRVEVDWDSKVRISWRSTESLWQIRLFVLHYCQENGRCRTSSSVLSPNMSLELPSLDDKKYDIELYSLSFSEECGQAQGRPYRSVLFGNIISDFDVSCTRDHKNFYTNLGWKIDPAKFDHIYPNFSFSYRYKVSGTDVMKKSTERYDLRKVCKAETGECSLGLEKLIRVDSYFEFGVIARAPDSVVYFSKLSRKEKCILRTKALTKTDVEITDETEKFPSMVESMDTQRVVVIDQNIFSRTDGAVISSMVIVGDPEFMRQPLGQNLRYDRYFDTAGKLLPTRITPPDWNIFSVWNTGQSHIDDPKMHCAWMWGSPSDYIVCAIGVEKCTASSFVSCNGPLITNKAYGLKIRGCTTAGCADTEMFLFSLGTIHPSPDESETPEDSLAFEVLLILIGCIIIGGTGVVVVAVLLLRWSEMRQMHHEQRFQLIDFNGGVGQLESSVDSRSTVENDFKGLNKSSL